MQPFVCSWTLSEKDRVRRERAGVTMNTVFAWIIGLFIIAIALTFILVLAKQVALTRQVIIATGIFVITALLAKIIFGLSGDENAYQSEAIGILQNWRDGTPFIPIQPWTKLGLSYLLATFYFFTTPSMYLGVLLLTPFISSLPLIMGQSAYNFFGDSQARQWVAWSAVLLPQILIWSPWLLREGISFFVLGLGILATSLMHKGRIVTSSFVFGFSLILMMFIRVQLTWVLLSLFVASLLFVAWSLRRNRKQLLIVAASGTLIVALFAATQLITAPSAGILVASESVIISSEIRETVIRSNASSSENLAVTAEPAQESGILSTVRYTASNLPSSLFGPFPWQWKNLSWVLTGLDGILMLLIVSLSLLPILMRRMPYASISLILWAGALPVALGNSLTLANYGIAMRVRANIAVLLLPIAIMSAMQICNWLRSSRRLRNQCT